MLQCIFQGAADQIRGWKSLQLLGIPVERNLTQGERTQMFGIDIGNRDQIFQGIAFVSEIFPPGSMLFLMVKRLFCTVFFVLIMSLFLIQLFFDLLELGGQFFGADADLQNIVRGSKNQSSSYIIKIFIVADNQKFTVHTAVFGCADQINPVHDRHLQITDNEIRMHALSHFQGLLSIGGRSADMETKRTPVQHGAKCNFYNRFVIDDQYLVHKFLPLLR